MTERITKSALRTTLKELREELAAREPDAGEALAQRFPMKLLQRYGPIVSGFWPIGSEIDPRPLMKKLASAGAKLCLPRMEAGDGMSFRLWQEGDALEPRGFGLSEPLLDAVEVRPTLILMPLLGFDAEGHRLGYGKGHYDRAIEALRREGRVFCCGLAYDGQRVTHVPQEDHDQPLDWVVTPTGNLPLFLARAAGA